MCMFKKKDSHRFSHVSHIHSGRACWATGALFNYLYFFLFSFCPKSILNMHKLWFHCNLSVKEVQRDREVKAGASLPVVVREVSWEEVALTCKGQIGV